MGRRGERVDVGELGDQFGEPSKGSFTLALLSPLLIYPSSSHLATTPTDLFKHSGSPGSPPSQQSRLILGFQLISPEAK